MTHLIAELTARIEDFRSTNKNPCKSYTTEAAADKAGNEMALKAAGYFSTGPVEEVKSARYVVFYVAAWGRWVACIDLTELLQRKTSTGGYLGYCKGFFTY